jgi:predicted MFS family arabinose efflux permease
MSVPPYVVAAVTTCASGYISDKIQKRAIVAMISSSIAVIGFALLLGTHNANTQYAGLFLAAAGGYPLIPVVISWGANNSGGSLKKGIAAAIIVSVGNAGGVMSSFIYPATDKPRYRKGHTICMAYNLMVFVLAGIMWLYLGSQNRKKEERNAARDHAWTAEERKELEDAGDKVDWFKYTI